MWWRTVYNHERILIIAVVRGEGSHTLNESSDLTSHLNNMYMCMTISKIKSKTNKRVLSGGNMGLFL